MCLRVGHFCLVIKQYWTLFEPGKWNCRAWLKIKCAKATKCVRDEEARRHLSQKKREMLKRKRNKTGMDRFQDCCKAKATNALLQS